MAGEQIVATVITERFGSDQPITQGDERSWLDYEHPAYQEQADHWAEARAHYTGSLLSDDHIKSFLIRKSAAESWEAYHERQKLADYTPHFSTAVDSLAGMLFQVENNAKRSFGTPEEPGLGYPDDIGTPMHRIWRNADGEGTDWTTFWKQLAIELVHSHSAWITIDTLEQGESVIRLWPSLAVTNWRYENGVLVEAMVIELYDERNSIQDEPEFARQWVVYRIDGWTRYKKEKNSQGQETEIIVNEGTYAYEDEMERPVLPIFQVELPMNRHVGWMMARKANVIFNKESERDHLLRAANFPFLLLVMADKQFNKALQKIKAGVRALQVDPSHGKPHSFITPPSEAAQIATEVLTRKVDEFYVTFFQSYGDSARERTATEARQDISAGVGAFLQLLKAAVDEGENNALKLIAQVEYPADERRWFTNSVQRSEDFLPVNIANEIEKIKERYFGADKTIPLGKTGRMQAAKRIADWDGLEYSEEELSAALTADAMAKLTDLFSQLTVPPKAKAEMLINMLAAVDLIDPEAEVEMDDGEKMKLVDLIRERAEEMAEMQATNEQRLMEMGPITPGAQDGIPAQGGSEEDDEE